MYTTPPHYIILVHYSNSHIFFSCFPLPFIPFALLIHYFVFSFFIFSCLFIFFLLFLLTKWSIAFYMELHEQYMLLEIIPPSDTKQTTFTTEQFMTILHALGQNTSIFDKCLERKNIFIGIDC